MISVLCVASLGIIPILIDRAAYEPFREPKEILFRGCAIFGALLLVLAWLSNQLNWRRLGRQKWLIFLLGSIVIWAVITTAASSNRALSREALVTTIASVLLFLMFYFASELRPEHFLAVVIAGMINGIILVLQRFAIWNFIDPTVAAEWDSAHRLLTTGLLGNANDAGSFLVFAILTAVVLAIIFGGRARILASLVAAFLTIALAATETLTGLGAVAVGLSTLLIPRLRQRAAWVAVIIIALLVIGVAASNQALRERLTSSVVSIKSGRYEIALSGRAIPFIAAARMFADHPVLGVGPGCFKFHYFEYKIAAEQSYPKLQHAQMRMVNFGEVHNDHLQIAAETGVVGYLLFLSSSVAVVVVTRRLKPADPGSAFAREAGLAFPVAFLVLALAQFPLELAATRIVLIGVYAACCSWSTR